MHPKLANLTDEQTAELRRELRSHFYGSRQLDAPFKVDRASSRSMAGAAASVRSLLAGDPVGARAAGDDAEGGSGDLRIAGYSAVFDQRTEIGFDFWGIRVWWHEIVQRGSFRKALAAAGDTERDVVFLVNHDMNRLLARTGNGSLQLEERGTGLWSDARMAPTSLGKDTYELVVGEYITEQSFAFRLAEGGDDWIDDDAFETDDEWYLGTRLLREFEALIDTSVVTHGAYITTTIEPVATDERTAATGEESPEARDTQHDGEGSDQQLVGQGGASRSDRAIPDDQTHQEEPPCPQHSTRSATPSPGSSMYSRRRPSQVR